MILINFSHPLTPKQRAQLEELTGRQIVEERHMFCQFDNEQPFAPQVRRCVDTADLSSTAWQSEMILVNPPGYAPAASALLAELHGRMGHFPTIIRLRPVAGSTPTRYEVAELLNLQQLRDAARVQRLQQE